MTQTRIEDVGRLAWFPASRVTKWFVVGFWVVVLGRGVRPGRQAAGRAQQRGRRVAAGDAQSTQVVKQIEAFQSKNEFPAVIVYERPAGVTPRTCRPSPRRSRKFDALEPVKSDTVGPIPSEDGKALQVIVPVDAGEDGWDALGATTDDLRDIAKDRPDGLSMHITGPVGFAADSSEAFAGIDGKLLYSAMAVVIVILLLTYRSPVLWLIPVFSAGIALFVAQAVIYFLAKDDTPHRQRPELRHPHRPRVRRGHGLRAAARRPLPRGAAPSRGPPRGDGVRAAPRRARPSSRRGATVIAGMLCLLVATMNSTKGLGPVAAIGIAVGLLVMLTLLPALLVVCGRWVFWPVRPTYGSADHTRDGVWARVGRRIARAPRRTWVVTSVAARRRLVRHPPARRRPGWRTRTPSTAPPSPSWARRCWPGTSRPAPGSAGHGARQRRPGRRGDGRRSSRSTASRRSPTRSPRAAARSSRRPSPTLPTPTPPPTPSTGSATRSHGVAGADAIAGGDTATRADTLRASADDNVRIIPLDPRRRAADPRAAAARDHRAAHPRSAPSCCRSAPRSGSSALIFRNVLGFAGADSSLPLFVFVFLVALGIDYNIFLMTRVHEESKEIGTRRGALVGLAATGGVITSAGLVLAGTFAVLATLPVVTFAEIGIAVALGVLLDTIVVRAVLVTALNLDVRGRMWWPSRLASRDAALDTASVPPSEAPEAAREGAPAPVR